MKKISIIIMILVVTLASCKKTPEVNLKYVDVERNLVTVGMTTANIQCDYAYITTLKKAYLFYGEGMDESGFTSAEMRVVQNTLYVELMGLKSNTTYNYYYEFHNGFNSMRTALKSFKTEAGSGGVTLPTVVTAAITEISANSAKGGGEVTDDGGAEVTERGICWSTHADPTLEDSHVAAGSGTGAFTAAMSNLETNTTYHVRAYAINEKGTAYGLDREFVTDDGGCDCGYVDLGLPSGTLWATCNVGANSPEEYGDYFAWGETEPKQIYTWVTYKWCNDDNYEQLTKYCNNPVYGFNGFVDNLISLEDSDDAATINWGNDWCIPTKEQWQELIDHTIVQWTTNNGVYGRLYTAYNGNSLFLPAAGFLDETTGNFIGRYGSYWTNSLNTLYPQNAWRFGFDSDNYSNQMNDLITYLRCWGLSIRAVRKSDSPTPPSDTPVGAINGLFTINENGDQVYFSQGNLQYQASTNTWRFGEKQWDYVGGTILNQEYGSVYNNGVKCDNALISSSYTGWIDLFGWGTSGYHDISDPSNVYYQPWCAVYVISLIGYGPSVNMPSPDLTGSSSNYDWGVYNPISNGGNQTNQWRTLTQQEWDYLIHSRITLSGIRFAKGIVNFVYGLILLPDDWDASLYHFEVVNQSEEIYDYNIIDATNWSVLEQNGAVFLPVTGYRFSEPPVITNLDYGCYWSATHSYSLGGFSLGFSSGHLEWGEPPRCNGCSVRLVQDANPQK